MNVDSWWISIDCAQVPAVYGHRRGTTVALICDPSGSWATDPGPADALARALLDRLLDHEGPLGLPELDAHARAAARRAPVRHPDDLALDMALLVARARGPRLDVISAGACQAVLLRGDSVLARTPRQTVGEKRRLAGLEPRTGDDAELARATVDRRGELELTAPLHRLWTLRAGDRVLLASVRLAARVAHADGTAVSALLERRFHPEVVESLPDRDAPHLWTERQYSALALSAGPPPGEPR